MQNDWKLLVEHCFRSGSSAFAPEFFEYQTTVRMFEEAKRVGASDKEILSTIRAFMKIKGANEMQISDDAHYAQILQRYSNRTAERVALRGNRSSRFSAL